MSFLSTAVQSVLEQGSFCAVATTTPDGPHCTPLVFAYSGGRVWLTTSRGSVKNRVWKRDASVAGLVRHDGLAVSFTGTVRLYDALDRSTWGAAVAGATSIARATAGFSKKNARFFAGYAFDAHQVPLAWTPPGRVFVGVDLDRTALLDSDGVQEGRGRWGGETASHETFRRTRPSMDPLSGLPAEIADGIGRGGEAGLAVAGARGVTVLPVRWSADEHGLFAALPAETLQLADAGADADVALTIDRASAWRARDMVGAMVQGTGSIYATGHVGSGGKALRALAADTAPGADAVVRVVPRRLVWWKGWSGGSAAVT